VYYSDESEYSESSGEDSEEDVSELSPQGKEKARELLEPESMVDQDFEYAFSLPNIIKHAQNVPLSVV
jgi:hypothetical protein